MSSDRDPGRSAVGESELIAAVQKLSSADAQRALVRVYACAALFRAPQSDDVAEARAGEEAALRAMERIAIGRSTDTSGDLLAADAWAGWHAKRVEAEAQMESKIAATVAHVMHRAFGNAAQANRDTKTTGGSAKGSVSSSPSNSTNTKTNNAATPDTASASKEACVRAQRDFGVLQRSIMSDLVNAEDHNRMNVSTAKGTGKAIAKGSTECDTPAAEAASTRTPLSQEAQVECHAGGNDDAPPSVPTEASSGEAGTARCRPNSIIFPKLTPPAMSVSDIAPAALTGEEAAAAAAPAQPTCRLSYEDNGLQFTQADFDGAREEVRRQRGGSAAKTEGGTAAPTHAGRPSALVGLSDQRLACERLPPPPRQVEDAALHYFRRQLFVRHLRPFPCPLKALMFRLAEGDSASAALSATSVHGSEGGSTPHLSDPLMLRMAAELRDVCLVHPVPRVRVRSDAQVYRRDHGYFKADEVRVQLHVEVVPVSGPMAGEVIHVWVRVPAGYPFVAPRAHLTVELPHHRCTGVAVDKVPHLIALSFDAALTHTSDVCPGPVHEGEVEQLRPLEGPVNSGWGPSLTLRHMLTALADLFSANEFKKTARELQSENLLHSGLQRARVNMYEEEGGAGWEALVVTPKQAAVQRSANRATSFGSDEDDATTGEDSMGIDTNARKEVAPSYLLLCNGPFLTKPAVAPSSSTTGQTPAAHLISAESSVERQGGADGAEDDEVGVRTEDSTPTRLDAAARRRQRKPLCYHEMESDRLCGPWRGCWGHVLYSPGSTATTTTDVNKSISSPIRLTAAEVAATGGTSAFAQSPRSPAYHLASRSLTFSALPHLSTRAKSDGSLFIRMKHHNAEAAPATVRLVHIASSILCDRGEAAPSSYSVVNTPPRRARGRLSSQSAWVNTALGATLSAPPPATVWASELPSEMGMDVLICVHDDEENVVGAPSDLAATLSCGCQRQRVSLHDLRNASAGVSSTVGGCDNNNSNPVAVVTGAIAMPPGSPMTAETGFACASESSLREEENRSVVSATDGSERCYAVVIDVPAGQEVSVVFSSDESACLAVPWEPAVEPLASATYSQREDSSSTEAAPTASPSCIRATAVMAAAQLDLNVGTSSHTTVCGGLLIELPYDAWQFSAALASAAVANGASREEEIHPHWPRHARFHGGHRVIPLSLKETTFRMYQLLQNTQVGSRGNVHAGSYLAAAPFSRVRQIYAATRSAKEQEGMVRRYGFWGWRNVLLPIFAPETRDLVYGALSAEQGDSARRFSATSAKMLAKTLSGWETAAIDDFGSACVQLHRDPDASVAYRAPFRPFAVLRTLALAVAYALEVLQRADRAASMAGGVRPAVAEAAALQECLGKLLWSATVLVAVTAAVKPVFLELCVALVDTVTTRDIGSSRNGTTGGGRYDREVQQALSQLTDLQRRAAQVLAASAVSAFPTEVAALRSATETSSGVGGGCVVGASVEPSPPTATLADRVAKLFNAPASPMLSSVTAEECGVATCVSGLLELVRSS